MSSENIFDHVAADGVARACDEDPAAVRGSGAADPVDPEVIALQRAAGAAGWALVELNSIIGDPSGYRTPDRSAAADE
jgi:hypothetical protein